MGTEPVFKRGDRVTLINKKLDTCPFPEGTHGRVVTGRNQFGQYGVEFDVRGDGHDCEGAAEAGYGYYVRAAGLAPLFPLVTNLDIIRKELLAKALGKNSYVNEKGKIFKLVATKTTLEDVYGGVIAEASSIVEQYASSFRMTEESLKRQLLEIDKMPEVTVSDIAKYGVYVCKYSSSLAYILPFHYRPRFLDIGKKFPLKDEARLKLERHVLFFLSVKGEKIQKLELFSTFSDIEKGSVFQQYHTTCWGSLPLPPTITGIKDIVDFRNKCESLLEVINVGSLANKNPPGLPPSSSLTKELIIEESRKMVLSVKDTPVGTLLKVIRKYDYFPEEYLGSIGRVIRERGERENLTLEFGFKHNSLHDGDSAGKNHQCYNIPFAYLEFTEEKECNRIPPQREEVADTVLSSSGEGVFTI